MELTFLLLILIIITIVVYLYITTSEFEKSPNKLDLADIHPLTLYALHSDIVSFKIQLMSKIDKMNETLNNLSLKNQSDTEVEPKENEPKENEPKENGTISILKKKTEHING